MGTFLNRTTKINSRDDENDYKYKLNKNQNYLIHLLFLEMVEKFYFQASQKRYFSNHNVYYKYYL